MSKNEKQNTATSLLLQSIRLTSLNRLAALISFMAVLTFSSTLMSTTRD